MTYPASLIVHTVNGPVPCCDEHARALRGLFSFLGARVGVTPALNGEECTNCVNEASKTFVDAKVNKT